VQGARAGLAEVARVLRPGGVLLVIDNSWNGGDFAELLRAATDGNAALDPAATERWWADRGDVVDEFIARHAGSSLTYHLAGWERRP
jgi:SAM-dependent methyltransferase